MYESFLCFAAGRNEYGTTLENAAAQPLVGILANSLNPAAILDLTIVSVNIQKNLYQLVSSHWTTLCVKHMPQ